MSLPPFGSEEFQTKIAALWPNQDRPDETIETIKALYDEVGEEIADAVAWYVESPVAFMEMKTRLQNQWGVHWSHWMAITILVEYDQYTTSQHLLRPDSGNFVGGI